jgi:membrane-bound metal-dependent hydrolase YbcI (DUF457 family)
MHAAKSSDTDVTAMADFQTHITTSTVLGIAGGLAAHAFYEVPLPSCILAGGLCSVAGMLPDLDSDSGVPLRESVAFAAAIIPMMLLERFAKWGFSFESTVLVSAIIYLVVRFGVAEALKNYTVHRGMFHSIPAALIAAELTFLIFDNENVGLRFLNAGAVFTGFMSHLILDELWSVDVNWGLVRFKSSFGSALKFWGDHAWANFATYGQLVLLTLLMTHDAAWSNVVEPWMTGRPIATKEKAWAQQLANWRQLYFQRQYGAIPPNAIDHPWNPLHQQFNPAARAMQFNQQYPNYYPPQAFDPARPLTSGSTQPSGRWYIDEQGFTRDNMNPYRWYATPSLNNNTPPNLIQPQNYNPALPFTNPNLARLPENYQSHAPSTAYPNPLYNTPSYQAPGTTPYQTNPLSPTRPSLNPNNWQLPTTTPSTNSFHYQSQYQTPSYQSAVTSNNTAWSAANWSNPTNFTQLGSGLAPSYQGGMNTVSHSYNGYDSSLNYPQANPYGQSSMPYNTAIPSNGSALDRFPSLQR